MTEAFNDAMKKANGDLPSTSTSCAFCIPFCTVLGVSPTDGTGCFFFLLHDLLFTLEHESGCGHLFTMWKQDKKYLGYSFRGVEQIENVCFFGSCFRRRGHRRGEYVRARTYCNGVFFPETNKLIYGLNVARGPEAAGWLFDSACLADFEFIIVGLLCLGVRARRRKRRGGVGA